MTGTWGGYRWGGGGWGASPRRRAFIPVVATGEATLLEALRAYLVPLAPLSAANPAAILMGA